MITTHFEYIAPKSLGEAMALLQSPNALALASDSRTFTQLKNGTIKPALLVDLKHVRELRGITQTSDAVRIGAATTLDDVLALRSRFAALAEAAEASGDMQERNSATMGASLLAPASASAVAALIYDAKIEVCDGLAISSLAADSVFAAGFELPRSALIVAVTLPLPADASGSAYVVMARPADGTAICGVGANVTVNAAGTITQCRVAITGALAFPARLTALEAALTGQPAAIETLENAATHAAGTLTCVNDRAASAAYRAQLTKVLSVRAIAQAIAKAIK